MATTDDREQPTLAQAVTAVALVGVLTLDLAEVREIAVRSADHCPTMHAAPAAHAGTLSPHLDYYVPPPQIKVRIAGATLVTTPSAGALTAAQSTTAGEPLHATALAA